MKLWKTAETDATRAAGLARELDLPCPLAACLLSRGLTTPEAIERFFKPRLSDLTDPFAIAGMDAAVTRIWQAIDRAESIAVYGDYDVDGITATGLLVRVLSRMGARVTPYLPNRAEEGYGLSLDGLERCVAACAPSLLITVDCGTPAGDAVREAQRRGIDVVVTDHHEAAGDVAPAVAVVNPKLGDDDRVRMLAGVGVGFKLCHALVKRGRDAGWLEAGNVDLRDYLEWVAIGTVADAVPLRGENRILVSHGLGRLGGTQFAGLKALMDVARIGPKVDAYHVGFVIGPRMNAVGRIGDALTALELVLTDHPPRAQSLAATLDAANTERKRIESRILVEAEEQIREHFDPDRHYCLVIGREDWHVGVIGIVASRLCARYRRPVVVVAFDEGGVGRGSCRSIEEFDLVAGLGECADLLDRFGGHRMAAGMEVRRSRFDAFRSRFHEASAAKLRSRDLRPVQRIDAWLELGEADQRLMEGIERAGPFGEGNPVPVWAARGVTLMGQPRVVGKDHLKMSLAAGGRLMNAIGFGMASRSVPDGPLDVAFTLERDSWMGGESLQLHVQDFRPAER